MVLLGKLTKFGIGNYSYDLSNLSILFPVGVPGGFNQFRDANTTLLGADGVFNGNGRDRKRSTGGSIQVAYWLRGDGTPSDMEQKLRALYEIQDWGEKRLFKQFADGVTVWTWATARVVERARQDDLSYVKMPVDLIFDCPKARWYGKPDMSFFESGVTFGDGLKLSTPKVEMVSVGNGSTVMISNAGNATAGAYVRWDIPVGVTLVNPTITRKNELDQIVEQITYTDTLVDNDVVEIDARRHQTLKNMTVTPSYENLDIFGGEWLTIPPGTNTLEISGSFTGGNADLTVDCWDTYF